MCTLASCLSLVYFLPLAISQIFSRHGPVSSAAVCAMLGCDVAVYQPFSCLSLKCCLKIT